jgi:hypothetical protein
MNKVSKTNHIHTSIGETLTRAEFNKRVNEAKENKIQQQKDKFGFNFCEDCDKNYFDKCEWDDLKFRTLDCSHEISVKECIESGRAEFAFDLDNIRIRCRYHHRIKDKSNLKFKANENISY